MPQGSLLSPFSLSLSLPKKSHTQGILLTCTVPKSSFGRGPSKGAPSVATQNMLSTRNAANLNDRHQREDTP